MKRPLGANPEELVLGSPTGGDVRFADTLKQYIGEYHVYKNGAVYSGPYYDPKTSKQLMKLIRPLENPICQTYLKLSKKLFSQYNPPTQYFKILDVAEYDIGKTERYVIQKINEPEKIYEVDFDTFKSVNKLNQTGINGFIYRRAHLEWKLVGDTNIVRALNQKAITEVEKTIPGLSTYLFSNPLEFVRLKYNGGDVDNLYTSGGEFVDDKGANYIGLYHIHKDKGAMKGPTHVNQPHGKLKPVGGTMVSLRSNDPTPAEPTPSAPASTSY
jgi:hypothetical protein